MLLRFILLPIYQSESYCLLEIIVCVISLLALEAFSLLSFEITLNLSSKLVQIQELEAPVSKMNLPLTPFT